jgi:serine/threonine protein kinase/tetratricopeptide (TPR) repeat protein
MIGRTLSHYKILEELSRGGMGVVYRALDTQLDREVALKVLPPELVSDAERKRRFVLEAKAAAALEHPHIAVIYEVGETNDGVSFIAMELIRGEKLSDALKGKTLPLTRSLELATEVAEGLSLAHEKGIVHRDLKPANIMVTEEGHAKIIDFGLAKLIEPIAEDASEEETALRRETTPGIVMGTVSYMSPEQARGETVGYRSDIFSLGIVLHEMLSGKPPFQGASSVETLNAIIKESAPRLPAMGDDVSAEVVSELQRITGKCLAKDPSDRYQSTRDIVVDLRAARRSTESGAVPQVTTKPRRIPALPVGIGAVALLLILATWLYVSRPAPREVVTDSRPSVAVLYFENNTGDASLDWLRTALTDMLVTDLSQSPRMQVLGTETLYQILKEMNRLDERVTSLEVVQEVAEKGDVNHVLLGSFTRAGDTIRINVRLQEATTGKILTSEKVEGQGESAIFPMVDDLTRRIKEGFELRQADAAVADRDLTEITTDSVEAYRSYAEGVHLIDQGHFTEAIPLFEKAVEVDPEFAMALAKLSIVHGNIFNVEKAREYAERALSHTDRLTGRERYYIEGRHYSLRPETRLRGIEAYEKGLALYPDDVAARNNVALQYFIIERFDEAIAHFEEVLRQDSPFRGARANLAMAYVARGEFEKGYRLLSDYIEENPDFVQGYVPLASILVMEERFEEAGHALAKCKELSESSPMYLEMSFWVQVALEDWDRVETTIQQCLESDFPEFRFVGGPLKQAVLQRYRGRGRESVDVLLRAAEESGDGSMRVDLLNNAAYFALDMEDYPRAIELARRAQTYEQQIPDETHSLEVIAIAQARLGNLEEAERTASAHRRQNELLPSSSDRRDELIVDAELALAGGDTSAAIMKLEQARASLPLTVAPPLADHIPVWYALASAYLSDGNEHEAAILFRSVVESRALKIYYPEYYIRSLYFLGKIHENRGDVDEARKLYRRFYEYWKDGDLDRERVEEVGKKLS